MSLMSLEDFTDHVGQKIGISRWFVLDQARIDLFANVTEDHQFIHVDAGLASETPFGTTIAHGFLTLSMLSAMSYDSIPRIEGVTMGINYGFDKIRFITPVTSGSRVRAHFTLASTNAEKPSEITNFFEVSVEIDGNDRPALVAEWISRQYFK
jgi:acyl dehydratase